MVIPGNSKWHRSAGIDRDATGFCLQFSVLKYSARLWERGQSIFVGHNVYTLIAQIVRSLCFSMPAFNISEITHSF